MAKALFRNALRIVAPVSSMRGFRTSRTMFGLALKKAAADEAAKLKAR